MRSLALGCVMVLAGCGVRPCKSGTVLLTVTVAGPAAGADAVEIDAQSGADNLHGRFGFNVVGSGTVEIVFPAGYTQGQSVTLRATAFKGAARLASALTTQTLIEGCSFFELVVGGGNDTSCDPGEVKCSEDRKQVLTCRTDGKGYDMASCGFGCNTTSTPARCLRLEPSGSVEANDYAGATAMTSVTGATTFNTDTGAISGAITRAAGGGAIGGILYRSVAQPGSTVRVGTFGFASLTVPAGITVSFAGKNPAALVVGGDLMIAGALDLVGDCTTAPSAGGQEGGIFNIDSGNGLGVRGGKGGVGAVNASSGGGGGGHGDDGGRGGNGVTSTGGAGGTSFGDLTVEPLVLIGGSGGGAGGPGMTGGRGGSGGGAIQLAANGAMTISGTINAGGCGGKGGGLQSGAGGGGSGGTILLEAATLKLTAMAVLASNGGGGGGGDRGIAGGNGAADTNAPMGGTTIGGGNGTQGGRGGSRAAPAGFAGINITGTLRNGGGGGGACGRIGLKTQDGAYTDEGATLSPGRSDKNAAGKSLATAGRADFQ